MITVTVFVFGVTVFGMALVSGVTVFGMVLVFGMALVSVVMSVRADW